jgi:acyl carrier protein
MDITPIDQKVKEVVALSLSINLQYVNETTRLDEDLFGAVQVATSIEDEFNITLEDSEVDKLSTVKELIDLVVLKHSAALI